MSEDVPRKGRRSARPLKVQDDSQLAKLIRGIAMDVVQASAHWSMFINLKGELEPYSTEVNQATCFWSLTIKSHRDVALWRLGRVYDQTRGTLSLPNWLATLSEQIAAFGRDEFRRRLAGSRFVEELSAAPRVPSQSELLADLACVQPDTCPVVKSLVELRNRQLGHNDARVLTGDVTLPGLSAQDVRKLIDRALSIINKYSQMYQASTYSDGFVGADDYKCVLNLIRKGILHYEAGLEAEEQRWSTGDVDGADHQ